MQWPNSKADPSSSSAFSKTIWLCPTRFEVPLSWQTKVRCFGMGERSAIRIAAELNQSASDLDQIILFGSAGGLTDRVRVGETFSITEVCSESETLSLYQPDNQFLSARLFTSKRLLSTTELKRQAHQKTQAELVDMEALYFLKNLKENVRRRVRIYRTIIDPVELDFPKPRVSSEFLKEGFQFIDHWRLYLKGMGGALAKLSS